MATGGDHLATPDVGFTPEAQRAMTQLRGERDHYITKSFELRRELADLQSAFDVQAVSLEVRADTHGASSTPSLPPWVESAMTEAQDAVVTMNERCVDMSARLASNTQAAQADLAAALEGHSLETAALRAELSSEQLFSGRLKSQERQRGACSAGRDAHTAD